jgi:hypothetical protein
VTTVHRWTGRETRALREALRLSVRDFAAYLGVGVRTVAKWEARRDTVVLRPTTQQILDTALAQAASDAQARFHTAISSHSPDATPTPRQGEPTPAQADNAALVPADTSAAVLDSGPAAWSALNPAEQRHIHTALATSGRYLDHAVVGYFRRQLAACMTEDGAYGPAAALPAVLALLAATQDTARDAGVRVRREALSVGAQAAEFAGWLYRDTGQSDHARWWYDRATEWAQEAGDLPMQGYVLLRRSQMAYDDRDAARVLGLAQAAHHGPWQLPSHVQAETAMQEARGLAMTGEPLTLVERTLDHARRLLDTATSDDNGSQAGGAYHAGTFTLRTASCYLEAGKPRHAAELYTGVLTANRELLSRRDRGYFTARLASALALAGEPDHAAHTGLHAAELATATSSQRTTRELTRTLTALRPWRARPGPRDLRDALTH